MNIIVAVDRNMGIGKNNHLLAHIKPDLAYFKRKTEGQIVVMGYNTYMSLPQKPLHNRVNVVLTSKEIQLEGAVVLHSTTELVEYSKKQQKEIFICGGASLYRQTINLVDRLYVTHIFDTFDADTFFPKIGEEWKIKNVICQKENINHKHPHIFVQYTKK